MQQAHPARLVVQGAGFHNGADQHFDEAAAHGVDHHRRQDAPKGIGQAVGQHGQQRQPRGRRAVGQHHGGAVAQAVHKAGRRQVHQKLGEEKHRGDQSDAFQRDAVVSGEGQEQQWYKIGTDGLGHIAQVTGPQGLAVVFLGGHGIVLSVGLPGGVTG